MSEELKGWRRLRVTTLIWACGAVMAAGLLGYIALNGGRLYPNGPTWQVEGGDAARGRAALLKHGCHGCHVIPDLPAPRGRVGPSLKDFRHEQYIAGVLPNTPDHLVDWVMEPQRFSPQTAMPDLGVTEAEARDIAAFLYEERWP